jgi:ATP-dependent RNA helicase DHX37/DHR1
VDTSLFRSTKKLGQATESKREIFSRALREKKAGINVDHANKILYDHRKDESGSEANDDFEEKFSDSDSSHIVPAVNGSSIGGGLKRPLELDDEGRPIIKKRKRVKQPPITIILPASNLSEDEEDAEIHEEEWAGFGSETESDDSLYDRSVLMSGDSSNSESEHSSGRSQDSNDSDFSEVEDSEEDSDNEQSRAASEQITLKKKARASAFKSWAEQQRNEAIGFVPSNVLSESAAALPKIQHVLRAPEQDPLPPELEVHLDNKRTVHAFHVDRSEQIQTARLALPVVAEEQKIMEAIFNHDVVIISGATGSGKTTQVPQFLLEGGFGDPVGPTPGMIGVTQPRRVAAVSMAKRVGDELGAAKDRVAHQIRFDTTVDKKTAIKFMTDGVLLREMANDFSLRKYSVIIIDEAHERTVNTDILISLMSRCIKARTQLAKEKPNSYVPLKLIIMSATLRVSDFRENSRLFSKPPPLVQAEGRQFDVTPHWARKTYHDYVEKAFLKVSRGHRKLPPGGILVFLTGQNEIRSLVRRLMETFTPAEILRESDAQLPVSAAEMPVESEDLDLVDVDPTGRPLDYVEDADSESELEIEGLDEPDSEFQIEGEAAGELLKAHVLPLYSQLPAKEQLRVFDPPPDGSRLIVLATNVAETSLTIPGIRYVFDSGRVKERKWDRAGVQSFETTWVSKASADQRMGRAGRTGPGHCYRLYSSAVYETFQDFSEPEIYRSPLEGVVLQLKALNITRIDNFPFPTPPDRSNLVKAETLLSHLGALDRNGKISRVGRELHNYPLNPRFAQMLRLGQSHNCVELTIAMVAVLDIPEIFIPDSMLDLKTPVQEEGIWTESDNQDEARRQVRRRAYNTAHAFMASLDPTSDALKLFAAIFLYNESEDKEQVCDENFIRSKALKEANQLRQQLTGIVNMSSLRSGPASVFSSRLSKPSDGDLHLLKQIVAAGFVDQIAIRATCLPTPPPVYKKPKRAIDVKYQTLMPSHDGLADDDDQKFVYLHPSSVLAHVNPTKLPRYIIYHRLQRTQNTNSASSPKTRMHPLTPIGNKQLAVLARNTTLLAVSKPVSMPTILESVDGKDRRRCSVVLSLVGRAGETGWPLLQQDVVQRREPKEGWVIEEYF